MRPTLRKPELGPTGRQWLKIIHLVLGAIWLGGGICMLVLRFAWVPSDESDPYSINRAVGLIGDWIIIPSALGSLVVGLLESWLTPWGFFKHRWVTVKWILTVVIIVSSPLVTVPWDREMEAISRVEGLMSLQNPVYRQLEYLVIVSGIAKVATLLAISAVSVLKPWRKRG